MTELFLCEGKSALSSFFGKSVRYPALSSYFGKGAKTKSRHFLVDGLISSIDSFNKDIDEKLSKSNRGTYSRTLLELRLIKRVHRIAFKR